MPLLVSLQNERKFSDEETHDYTLGVGILLIVWVSAGMGLLLLSFLIYGLSRAAGASMTWLGQLLT